MKNLQHPDFRTLNENNIPLLITGFLNEYQGPVIPERTNLLQKGVHR